MRITGIKAHHFSVPMPPGRVGGVGRLFKRDWIAVEVSTDAGLVGWGESHHGQAPAAIANLVDHVLGPQLVGLPPHPAECWLRIQERYFRTHSPGAAAVMAYSGIDIALWDIAGQAAGVPVCVLFGYAPKRVRAYVGGHNLTYQPVDDLVAEARRWREAGFRGMKIRIGRGPAVDAEAVRAVREAVGPDVEVFADVNARYRLADALALLERIGSGTLGWLEEPLAVEERAAYRRLRSRTAQVLAGGENAYSLRELEDTVAWADIIQPDVTKIGGLTPFRDVVAVARLWGVRVVPHAMHSLIAQAATLHALAGLGADTWLEHDPGVDSLLWQAEGPGLVIRDGWGEIPDRPGLGVRPRLAGLEGYPGTPGPSYGPTPLAGQDEDPGR
jgi:D-galactarolactone cycloisomerase